MLYLYHCIIIDVYTTKNVTPPAIQRNDSQNVRVLFFFFVFAKWHIYPSANLYILLIWDLWVTQVPYLTYFRSCKHFPLLYGISAASLVLTFKMFPSVAFSYVL